MFGATIADPLMLAEPKVLGFREGFSMDNGQGELAFIKLVSGETGGQFSVGEVFVAPGAGPTPHMHTLEDELFIVKAGSLELKIGDKTVALKEGDIAWAPRNVPHVWKNVSKTTAHMYVLVTGSNFEAFITPYFEALEEGNVVRACEIASEHGITIYPNGW